MENFKNGSLEITIGQEGDKTTICWYGKSDERSPGEKLNPYFDDLVNELSGEIIVDFRKLEYMNSSTVPPLIKLIRGLEGSGLVSKLLYDKESKWQAASFKALDSLSASLKCISVEGL